MKDKIPAYRVEIRSPDKMVALDVFASYLPTELIYDYKRHGQPTDAVAAEMIEAYAPQMGEIDTLKIIKNTGFDSGEVVAAATGIITITTN
jgi:hypothetical protein